MIRTIIKNDFVNIEAENKLAQPSVFNRVFSRLSKEGKPLGIIHPVYIHMNQKYYVLGVITHNNNGTTSFFPQLPGEIDFDHFTLQDISKNNHHFTRITNGERERVLPLSTHFLSNGTYFTLNIIQNNQDLVLLPPEINYPSVDEKFIHHIRHALIADGSPTPHTIMNLVDYGGSLIFQIFLLPPNINPDDMSFFPDPIFGNKDLSSLGDKFICCSVISHPKQNEYRLGIYCLKIKDYLLPTTITGIRNKVGFYSKLNF